MGKKGNQLSLSKSKFLAGCQCLKRLYLKVHEPENVPVPDQARQAQFDQGLASYYHIDGDGELNKDAAWYYPEPKDAAKNIKNYIAFWEGVEVKE